MSSSSAEVHKLLYDTMKADTAIMTLANGVYDSIPAAPWGIVNGYISIGNSDGSLDDADCIGGVEITFQIDCWSRQKGLVVCRRMVDAVRKALDRQDLELTDNALCELRVGFYQTFLDPDGITAHGVVQVTAYVEEPIE